MNALLGVLGLELLEAVLFGVPGGVLGGVTPFPFTRLSPEMKIIKKLFKAKKSQSVGLLFIEH